MLGLERKLEPGIQRELVLVLGIQAELSFRCTSSQVKVYGSSHWEPATASWSCCEAIPFRG